MAAILLGDFVWEGTSDERATSPYVIANKRDGHIFKEMDTGESFIHRSGDWHYINLGLAFIKATKSGRIVTDANGDYEVIFNTPFINNDYTVALSCEDTGGGIMPLAFKWGRQPTGFKIKSRRFNGTSLGNITVSWLATRSYDP